MKEFFFHRGGQAETSLLGDGLGILIDHHRAEDRFAGTAAERSIGLDAFEHGAHEFIDEDSFEIFRRFRALGGVFRRPQIPLRFGGRERGRELQVVRGHPTTSISACTAPAALMACRIEIMSRGPTPSAFKPLTNSCRSTPSLSNISCLPMSSSTWILVRGTTCVCLCSEKGC